MRKKRIMNQPPINQPPDPNRPQQPYQLFNQQFYNDQTQAHPQQPPPPYPYAQQPYPPQPNPYQPLPQPSPTYPPYQPGHIAGPPARPAKPKRPWLIGCGVAIFALLVCGLCSGVINATSHQTQTSQADSGAIVTPATSGPSQTVHMTTYTPSPKATAVSPTPTPMPPTPAPLPTPIPQPTQAPAPQPQPTQAPASQPTQAPAPQPTQAPATTGANGNPWGYDFNPGTLLTDPNPGFCDGGYFQCVTTFWKATNGYVVQCNNGLFSHSGGVRGACSRDGGPGKPLYTH